MRYCLFFFVRYFVCWNISILKSMHPKHTHKDLFCVSQTEIATLVMD